MGRKIDDGLTRHQRWYRKNNGRERARAASAAFREANPGYNAQKCREYYARNVELARQRKAEYDRRHRQDVRGTVEQREKEVAKYQRRRARLMAVESTLTISEWRDILNAHDHCCAYPGVQGWRTHKRQRGSSLQVV